MTRQIKRYTKEEKDSLVKRLLPPERKKYPQTHVAKAPNEVWTEETGELASNLVEKSIMNEKIRGKPLVLHFY